LTKIKFSYTDPTVVGTDVPAAGRLKFWLLHEEFTPNDVNRSKKYRTVKLVNGEVIVDLSPSPMGNAWQMQEMGPLYKRDFYTFLVPEAPLDDSPVNFTDLIFVDPKSMDPITAQPVAGWAVELDDLENRVTTIENLGFPPHVHPVEDITGLQQELGYTHEQQVASAQWDISHSLPYFPNVTVVDSAGTKVNGDVIYVSPGLIQLSFSGAFSGTAYLS
jgi:hypothetical protein